MDNIKYEKVKGTIEEVKFNKDDLEIFLALDVDGERKTVVIKSDQLIQFETDRITKQNLMLKFYNAWKERQKNNLPVYLELTNSQLMGESNV